MTQLQALRASMGTVVTGTTTAPEQRAASNRAFEDATMRRAGEQVAVDCRDLVKSFASGSVKALDGVSLTVREDEFFTLLGPSGCGKTTLLRLIAGFETQDEGSIAVH